MRLPIIFALLFFSIATLACYLFGLDFTHRGFDLGFAFICTFMVTLLGGALGVALEDGL